MEPVPDGSKTDPLLAKAEPVSDADGASMITYLRKGKNQCATAAEYVNVNSREYVSETTMQTPRAGPSQGEEDEELVDETETTRSLSLSELRDMRKDFTCRPGEHTVTWLLRCWDSGASSLELEGKEPKQLGSLSREGDIDKAIGKGAPALSLWRRLLSAMKERSSDSKKIDRSYFPPVQTSISAIRSQHSSAQESGYRGYTQWGTLWFYLRDHGEDMRKWDGKPTSTLEARVRELQGKTIPKGSSSRKIAAPVSSGQFPRQRKRADLTPDFNERAPDSYIQEMGNEYYDQD
ncbi:hypothetical protein QYF61_016352 [Mycteria americana]|uniref:Uncharacterized protein n=1 Tax=Mycteria americana TaxID=33587 RepID=A0AAN7RW78_MYCAM|nr:hypothetical protein QYF61_016352 [Mycteria americana]